MSWKDKSTALKTLLQEQGFGHKVDNTLIWTKQIHGKQVVIDIANEKVVFWDGTEEKTEDDDEGTLADLRVEIESIMQTDNPQTQDIVPDQMFVSEEKTKINNISILPTKPNVLQQELSIETIKKYINDKATDEEAFMFLQLCKARGLNPFLKEAYLIKYNHTSPATMVVGKDAFMNRADNHPQYDGFNAGIILEITGDDNVVIYEEREGTFLSSDENVVGGWAIVYRKDKTHGFTSKVALHEYVGLNAEGRPNKQWSSKPATMIRKVALVQALREAFPSDFSGMYDHSEMGVELE